MPYVVAIAQIGLWLLLLAAGAHLIRSAIWGFSHPLGKVRTPAVPP
jgi:hypothetical protein